MAVMQTTTLGAQAVPGVDAHPCSLVAQGHKVQMVKSSTVPIQLSSSSTSESLSSPLPFHNDRQWLMFWITSWLESAVLQTIFAISLGIFSMRLVDVKTFELVEFVGEHVPPYAVLSHRWGKASDEVSFELMSNSLPKAQELKGFAKIAHCAHQAEAEGLQYCWVDTCCIDKKSSAELSEAINSMFALYQSARVCYAYLEDVVAPIPAFDSPESYDDWESHFIQSQWFTRGWTLQELIAPRFVRFYSKDWAFLGGRERYAELISERCGIASEILTGSTPLDSVILAEKMRWASCRQTTRLEDIAYCLLGIFDVNMPLLYGEGPKAFQRLQEEIIKRTNDHSIFAWTDENASHATFYSLFARSPANFENAYNLEKIIRKTGVPFAITNRGLNITLPLRQIDTEELEYLALLDCKKMDEDGAITIHVRRLSQGSDQFTRVDTWHVTSAVDQNGTFTPQSFYVPENLSLLKDIIDLRSRVEGFKIQATLHDPTALKVPAFDEIEIVDAWPSRHWHKDESLVWIDSLDLEDCGVARARVLLASRRSREIPRLLVLLSYRPTFRSHGAAEIEVQPFAWKVCYAPKSYDIEDDCYGDKRYPSCRYSRVHMHTGFDGERAVIFVEIRVPMFDLLREPDWKTL